MKSNEIVRRGRMCASSRSNIEDVWDSIERYFAPYRGRFFKDEASENSIDWRRPFVYDGTGIMASQHLASSLHSSLTSASTQFFSFRYRQDDLNEDVDAKAWLEECGKRVYESLQDSNFNVEINETYQDLVNFGTSVIIEETEEIEGKEQLIFKSIPLKECYFEPDTRGNIVNFYRKLYWTGLEMYSFFGDKIPEDILDAVLGDAYNSDIKYVIWFGIFKRDGVEYRSTESKVLDATKRPYGFKYVLENEPDSILGEEGGYYEMPAFVPRWSKTSESVWGNSPAMVALSDNLTLQRLIELSLAAIEKAIDPPVMTTQRGLIGDLDLNAGGLTTVREMNQLAPFQSAARFDVQQKEIERLQNNIKDYFFINQIMLPPMQPSPVTATEISMRAQQLERIFGPTLARIQTDLLSPCLSRTFRINFRAGKFPEMPPIVAEMQGEIEIEYVGTMAKSQEASNIMAVERWIGMIGQAAQIRPEVLDIPDWDAMFKDMGYKLGVPAKYQNSSGEIEAERADRKQQQQAMQQAMLAEQQGKGAKAMGEGRQAMIEGKT
jgi:hypothetical protein